MTLSQRKINRIDFQCAGDSTLVGIRMGLLPNSVLTQGVQ